MLQQSILIIDDDSKSRKRCTNALEGSGVQILEASSLEQGLDLFGANRPHVVLLALRPGTTAVQFVQYICSEDPGVGVIALIDSRTAAKTLLDAGKAGASSFVKKPVLSEEIRSLVSRMLFTAESKKQAAFPPASIEAAELNLKIASRAWAVNAALKVLASLLSGVMERSQLSRFILALDEGLRNAYEHGNLGVTGAEKQRLCESEELEEVLRQKEEEAMAAGKVIEINLRCSAEEVTCAIEDQGEGFDWKRVQMPSEETDLNTALHGRGLIVVRSVFDSVFFNEKGNRVTMSKRLKS